MLLQLVLTLLLFFNYSTEALRLGECGSHALGLESGELSDSQLTASTSFDRQSVGPQNARLRNEKASGAWCPKPQIDKVSYEFLQINLETTHVVTAIETQGRFGNGTGREYAQQYMIDYLRPGTKWIRYTNRTGHTLMTGNTDTVTTVLRSLDPPIIASRIRIVPYSETKRTICMRAEVYGCIHKEGVMYYSTVPEGSRMGEYDFRDVIFEDNQLFTETGIKRGLGLLSDGYVADASPFLPTNSNGSWIGWNKHHTGGVVTILYEFDQLRNFSEVMLAVYGHRMDSIDVIFSQDGTNFPLSSQISSLDRLAANSTVKRYDVRIPLHKRMAKKVRLSIKFPGEWFFLTEIHFHSGAMAALPLNYADLYSNDTSSTVSEEQPVEVDYWDSTLFSVLVVGMSCLFIVVICILCGILCSRRRSPSNKQNIYVQDVKRDTIITQIGSKPATHVYSGGFSPPGYNGTLYATDKTTSTSISSKSNSSLGKTSPPTWNDFHFPPPPGLGEERIYAEPCMTMPLLQTHKKIANDARNSLTTRKQAKKNEYTDNSLHYATGNLFADTYGFDKVDRYTLSELRLGDDVGEGKLTLIRECRLPNKNAIAVYKCAKDRNNLQSRKALLDELKTLSQVSHPNIVRLLGTDENVGLILEYMPLGDVKHYLNSQPSPLPLSSILSILADVCSGMAYLESRGLVHGHLTPTHVLLSDTLRAKVASPRGPSHIAQVRYSAPESIISNQFSCKSDTFAYAICCHSILNQCRSVPFEGLSNTQVADNALRILSGDMDVILPIIPDTVPRGLREVLNRCYEADPPSRPSFAQIYTFISRFHS